MKKQSRKQSIKQTIKQTRKQSRKQSSKTHKKSSKVNQFVCTGNTCRSAAMQALARAMYPELTFESCGTGLRTGKEGEGMSEPMVERIRLKSLKKQSKLLNPKIFKKAYKNSKKHKSRSCTCKNIMKVSNSDGIMFVVADSNIANLKKIISNCKNIDKNFKEPKIMKINKKDIYDGYEQSCELRERRGKKCKVKTYKKENKAYKVSLKQIINALKNNKELNK